ncbi:MAG TPA: excinuclease ABC subunit UvrB [Candidatus Goldiibacteriota bacterium]|nr:excinuclease ABC subunit UvrB [Candidatus Goldiibacteriota bacterium]
MEKFRISTPFEPAGDQPQAIKKLAEGIEKGKKSQVLLGVTGSGKTFTMAKVIEETNRPALIISHNKTLAAQLYLEFKQFFPDNAVEYFVSYYDYYQPEAYIPHRDMYIEKDSAINDELERLRLSATHKLLTRRDVIIVASVSCIYGVGSPEVSGQMRLYVEAGERLSMNSVAEQLVALQYKRNEFEFKQGIFRVKGDIMEIYPAYSVTALRLEFFGDTLEKIAEIDPVSKETISALKTAAIYAATHFAMPEEMLKKGIKGIKEELEERLKELKDKPVEYERLKARTSYDIEMLEEMGYCKGIENYSRIMEGRKPGSAPYTLIDYFPRDFLMFIDESHVTVPQIRAMQAGDFSRKKNLVDYGFRLPCAYDNRPLKFEEFEKKINQVIYVSATPDEFETEKSGRENIVEQIVRPTGLIDPEVEVRPVKGQVDDLLSEIKKRAAAKERVLVTTLTKKMAETLTAFLKDKGVKCRYLHSDVDTLERVQIIRELRQGKFDALIGINLLREGLDIPEVSLVAILDADKEGFLRSETSLIQTIGRAARNLNGRVIMYADTVTGSMERAIGETNRRREKQLRYNKENNITPKTIVKEINTLNGKIYDMDYFTVPVIEEDIEIEYRDKEDLMKKLEEEMIREAKSLNFEKAAILRDKIEEIRQHGAKAKKRKKYNFKV